MEDFEASGQTIPEWVSSQEGITEYQFHYWRKKLKAETDPSPNPPQVDCHGWTTLEVSSMSTNPAIELKMDDLSLMIPEDVSEHHLSLVLRVLRNG
nr:hypothetical protein [Halalkalibacter hemicellulosilyticus]